MNNRYLLNLVCIALLFIGENVTADTTGERALAEFKQALQTALKAGMSQGVIEAIDACNIKAPAISASLSNESVRVGRSSHRLRNPNNIAPDWVNPIMAAYLDNTHDRKPRSVSLPGDRTGYVEPIVLQPVCTTCHGTHLAQAVRVKISQLYPEDQAVGFNVGDLRGVFWVEYPRNSQ